MSARDELFNEVTASVPADPPSDSEASYANRLLAEYRAEVLREAADQLANAIGPRTMANESARVAALVGMAYSQVDALRRMAEGEAER